MTDKDRETGQPKSDFSQEEERATARELSTRRAPSAEVQSQSVTLTVRDSTSLGHRDAAIASSHAPPAEEPSRNVPIVPPGDYEEDVDDSPPVNFVDLEGERLPAGDASAAGPDDSEQDDGRVDRPVERPYKGVDASDADRSGAISQQPN